MEDQKQANGSGYLQTATEKGFHPAFAEIVWATDDDVYRMLSLCRRTIEGHPIVSSLENRLMAERVKPSRKVCH